MQSWLAAAIVFLLAVPQCIAGEEVGFKRIFNGRDLKGWKASDTRYWYVEDDTITGRSTELHSRTANQLLVWQNGELDDFELKFSFRLIGSPESSGGFLFRGRVFPERANQPAGDFKLGDWNEYHLIVQGVRQRLFVNGKLAAEMHDGDPNRRAQSEVFALQLDSGPPTVVQFKNLRLKRLKLTDGRKKIVMVAGKPSHGPGEHEYNAGCSLLKKCLDESDSQVVTALYRDGWPADATAFDNADAILLYMNGGPKHPIMGRNRLAEIDALMNEGVGLVCAHFAVEVPAEKGGPAYQDWIGGYYENGFSTNPHWAAKAELHPSHPVTRGVKPFEIKDEWYFNMRFRPNGDGVVSILRATPSDETRQGGTSFPKGPLSHIVDARGRSETLMWVVERKDGGCGVGYTGGHFHSNWQDDHVRKLMLNALLWAAKVEVPKDGVKSTVTADEMRNNLDEK